MSNQPRTSWTDEKLLDGLSLHHRSKALEEIERLKEKIAELKAEATADNVPKRPKTSR
jgi:hypothetical protein